MEQLIHAFGIDIKLIIIQMVNFVILMSALTYFLYKPVLKVLADREEKIVQGIKDAEAAAVAKGSAESEKQSILSSAHAEAEVVAKNAKTFADERSEAIVAEARTKAESVIKDAQQKSEELKLQAKKESEAEIAKLAVLAAEKILREKNS